MDAKLEDLNILLEEIKLQAEEQHAVRIPYTEKVYSDAFSKSM